MKAVYYERFREPPSIRNVADPTPTHLGVVIKVEATGLCRSDWHGWMGHDPDIVLPHVPGHELAGTIQAVGTPGHALADRRSRRRCRSSAGCGHCFECNSGNHQVCEHQFQPGFTAWGSFAEYVAMRLRRHQPRALAGRAGFRHRCKPRLPFRHLVPRDRRPGPRQAGRMGAGLAGSTRARRSRRHCARSPRAASSSAIPVNRTFTGRPPRLRLRLADRRRAPACCARRGHL